MKAALENIKSDDYLELNELHLCLLPFNKVAVFQSEMYSFSRTSKELAWFYNLWYVALQIFFFFTWHVWDTKWYKLLMVELLNSKHTLLFMKALRHWMSLCWFFLSMFSCLRKRKSVSKEKDKSVWMSNPKALKKGNFLRLQCQKVRKTYCFLSRSLSSTSKSSPRPSWPKLFTQLKTERDSQRTLLEYINQPTYTLQTSSLQVRKVWFWRWAGLQHHCFLEAVTLFHFFFPYPYYWQTAQVTVAPAALFTIWVILCLSENATHDKNMKKYHDFVPHISVSDLMWRISHICVTRWNSGGKNKIFMHPRADI